MFGRLFSQATRTLGNTLVGNARNYASSVLGQASKLIVDPNANVSQFIGQITNQGKQMLADTLSQTGKQTLGSIFSQKSTGGNETVAPSMKLALPNSVGYGYNLMQPFMGNTGISNQVEPAGVNAISQNQGFFNKETTGYSGQTFGNTPLTLKSELPNRQGVGFTGQLAGQLYNTPRANPSVEQAYSLERNPNGQPFKNYQIVGPTIEKPI